MNSDSEYHLYKKEMVPVLVEKENITKIMNEMKKQANFLESTKWMFENNSQLPTDNFSPNPLWSHYLIWNNRINMINL